MSIATFIIFYLPIYFFLMLAPIGALLFIEKYTWNWCFEYCFHFPSPQKKSMGPGGGEIRTLDLLIPSLKRWPLDHWGSPNFHNLLFTYLLLQSSFDDAEKSCYIIISLDLKLSLISFNGVVRRSVVDKVSAYSSMRPGFLNQWMQ